MQASSILAAPCYLKCACACACLQLATAEKEKAEAEAGAIKARTEFGTLRAEVARLKVTHRPFAGVAGL